MTARRRFAATATKTPTQTTGNDRPQPACDGDWVLYWRLIDQPRDRYTRAACLAICNATNDDGSWACPIRETCWTEHADEEWVQALANTLPPQRGCDIDDCDRPHNAKGLCGMHYRRAIKETPA